MLHYIEIRAESLPLITALNNGVRPRMENQTTYFVYDSDQYGRPSDIITADEFEQVGQHIDKPTVIPIVTF